jgi:spore coat polysaccharide biosynthesis protein SpsF
MSSKRFPGKVLKDLNGEPMLVRQIDRIRRAKNVQKIVVATSIDVTDDSLYSLLKKQGIDVFRGELEDVLKRFVGVMNQEIARTIVRLTADCPLVMPELLDEIIQNFWNGEFDYLSNTLNPTFPDGLDIEVFSRDALSKLDGLDLSLIEREHVTLGFLNQERGFRCRNFEYPIDYSELRWTVDYPEDLEFVRKVYSHFSGRESEFGFQEVLELLETNNGLKSTMTGFPRNEALKRN